jgi:hypothetical protein
MEARDFPSLFHAEAVKGEKAAYFLRWVIIITLLPAAVLMLATGRYLQAVPYSFALIGVVCFYNLLLTVLYRRGGLDKPAIDGDSDFGEILSLGEHEVRGTEGTREFFTIKGIGEKK